MTETTSKGKGKRPIRALWGRRSQLDQAPSQRHIGWLVGKKCAIQASIRSSKDEGRRQH